MRDPVRTNQSKHRDAEGVLRYDADDNKVFPGATGVRKPPCPNCGGPKGYPSDHAVGCPNSDSIGKLGEWDNNA